MAFQLAMRRSVLGATAHGARPVSRPAVQAGLARALLPRTHLAGVSLRPAVTVLPARRTGSLQVQASSKEEREVKGFFNNPKNAFVAHMTTAAVFAAVLLVYQPGFVSLMQVSNNLFNGTLPYTGAALGDGVVARVLGAAIAAAGVCDWFSYNRGSWKEMHAHVLWEFVFTSVTTGALVVAVLNGASKAYWGVALLMGLFAIWWGHLLNHKGDALF